MYDTLDCVKVVVHVQKGMCELMGVSVLLYALVYLHIAIAGPLTMPTNSCTLLYSCSEPSIPMGTRTSRAVYRDYKELYSSCL